jgi:(3,5-dihydroxyphenyl)acetyl-CoA 1,2-dioxygenase
MDGRNLETALQSVGLSEDDVQAWIQAEPDLSTGPTPSAASEQTWAGISPFISLGELLLDRLPERARRNAAEHTAADAIGERLRAHRIEFMRRCAGDVYARLTEGMTETVRVDELVSRAALTFPGLSPNASRLEKEAARRLKDKHGDEIDQGLFLWQVLAHPAAGAHLVYSMLRPTPESLNLLGEFQRSGRVELELATVTRKENAAIVEHRNTRYLNAEDDDTNRSLEIAVDLVILDPACAVGVLRGAMVAHPKFAGRRIFNAGLNLTRLYEGSLSFMFYMARDLGLVNKIYRGHSPAIFRPSDGETGVEKPWIAAVEAFAIGGGCQLLLVMDYVLAEQGSYFNLPARKEGIIPGAANLRLPRFVGDRMARRGILFDQPFPADGPEGQLLCDEIVPAVEMDSAIERMCESLSSSGVVSAASNRKAIRVGQEPLSVFQAYMATYAREQAFCHLSPALVRNLEQYWISRQGSDTRG